MKINSFRGDLSDISAETATLCRTRTSRTESRTVAWCTTGGVSCSRLCMTQPRTTSTSPRCRTSTTPPSTTASTTHTSDSTFPRFASVQVLSLLSCEHFSSEISIRSPRKLFIFIIEKYVYRIKFSKKLFIYFLNGAWARAGSVQQSNMHMHTRISCHEAFFEIKSSIGLDTWSLKYVIFIIQINTFRSEVTDTSAGKTSPVFIEDARDFFQKDTFDV